MTKRDENGFVTALLECGATIKKTILENVPHRLTWGEKSEVITATSSNLEITRRINTIIIRGKQGGSEIHPDVYGFEYLFKLGDTMVFKPK